MTPNLTTHPQQVDIIKKKKSRSKDNGIVTVSSHNSYTLVLLQDSSASTEIRVLHHQERRLNDKTQLEQAFHLVEEAQKRMWSN